MPRIKWTDSDAEIKALRAEAERHEIKHAQDALRKATEKPKAVEPAVFNAAKVDAVTIENNLDFRDFRKKFLPLNPNASDEKQREYTVAIVEIQEMLKDLEPRVDKFFDDIVANDLRRPGDTPADQKPVLFGIRYGVQFKLNGADRDLVKNNLREEILGKFPIRTPEEVKEALEEKKNLFDQYQNLQRQLQAVETKGVVTALAETGAGIYDPAKLEEIAGILERVYKLRVDKSRRENSSWLGKKVLEKSAKRYETVEQELEAECRNRGWDLKIILDAFKNINIKPAQKPLGISALIKSDRSETIDKTLQAVFLKTVRLYFSKPRVEKIVDILDKFQNIKNNIFNDTKGGQVILEKMQTAVADHLDKLTYSRTDANPAEVLSIFKHLSFVRGNSGPNYLELVAGDEADFDASANAEIKKQVGVVALAFKPAGTAVADLFTLMLKIDQGNRKKRQLASDLLEVEATKSLATEVDRRQVMTSVVELLRDTIREPGKKIII